MEEVDDEPLHFERVAALDIAKATLEACIRVPSKANPAAGPGGAQLRHHQSGDPVAGRLVAYLGCGQGGDGGHF